MGFKKCLPNIVHQTSRSIPDSYIDLTISAVFMPESAGSSLTKVMWGIVSGAVILNTKNLRQITLTMHKTLVGNMRISENN